MNGEPPFGIKRVAKAAGVSVSTVSRALRGHKSIPHSTREHVFQVAAALGYKSNPILSEVMSSIRASKGKGKMNVAYLANDPSPESWQGVPTFREYMKGVQSRAQALGFSIDVIWSREQGMDAARLEQILRARGVKALLIGPMPGGCAHLSLEWEHYSSVTLGHSLVAPKIDRVVSDQKYSVELALRRAKKMGYRRPGLFMSKWQDTRCGFNFSAGYYAWTGAHDFREIPPLLFDSFQKGEVKSWLKQHTPDVIISSGLDCFYFLKEVTSRIGNGIGYVDIDLATDDGLIAGVVQNHFSVGSAAIDLLAHQIGHGETGIPKHRKTVMIEGHWVPGATLQNKSSTQTLHNPKR